MYLTMYKGYKISQDKFGYKIMQGRVTVEKGFCSTETCKRRIDGYK